MMTRRRLLGSFLGACAAAFVPTAWKPSASVLPVVIRDHVTADRVLGYITGQPMTAAWLQSGTLVDLPGVERPPDGFYHCVITDDGRGHRTYYLNGRPRPDAVFPVATPGNVPCFAEFDRLLDAVTVRRLAESR